MGGRRHFPDDLFRRCGDLGFLGLHFPTERGGGGGNLATGLLFVEELARCGAGAIPMAISVQTLVDTSLPGVRVSRRLDKLGMHSSDTAEPACARARWLSKAPDQKLCIPASPCVAAQGHHEVISEAMPIDDNATGHPGDLHETHG
jgi:hypothetical protein